MKTFKDVSVTEDIQSNTPFLLALAFILSLIAFIFLIPTGSFAQNSQSHPCYSINNVGCVPVDTNNGLPTSGAYPGMVTGSTLIRANNTTAYTGSQTVCLVTSVTLCAPGTIQLANANGGKLIANRVTLLKSGPSITGASFIIWFFSASPVVTVPNQFDATTYSGPRIADMPNYLGNAACATAIATSDASPGVWYECTLSNPNTAGALDFQAVAGTQTVFYLISVAASSAYTPTANETFTPYVGGFY